MAKRIVVVGGGPGGLAASMLLAHSGFQVTLLERQSEVGGRTSTFDMDGFRFDLGPTFFLYPRILEEIFREVGYELRDEVEMVRLDPQYRLVFGEGGQLDATPDIARMEAQIARLSPGDERGFQPFLEDNRGKLERFRPVLESSFSRLRDLFRPDVLRSLPYLRPWRSLHAEVGRFFRDPRLKLAFTFQGKYVGMSPFQCPSLFSILAFLEYEHGVHHPLGGCGAVSRAMARIAERLGVEIRVGEEVRELLFRGRRAVGVATGSGRYEADAVVVNADFADAMTRLVPDRLRRRWTDRRLAGKRYSCSTFMMYLGLEGLQRELPHHTIYLSRNYLDNLADIERHHRLSEDPSIYVQNASVTDSSLAPSGHSALYVLAPVTHEHPNVDWERERGAFRERVLGQLEKVGVEDASRRIRVERVVTPADWQRQYRVYRGATFNLAHNLRQMLYWRPHNRFEDLEGVYLVGGGTHPGSGLPVIYSSARITSAAVCQDLGVASRGESGGAGRSVVPASERGCCPTSDDCPAAPAQHVTAQHVTAWGGTR